MDRQQELEREVEFLRKLVTSQNEMIGRLIAERACSPLPPQIIPYPVPTPGPSLPPVPPFPGVPMWPWDPQVPIWGPTVVCNEGCVMIPMAHATMQ